MSLHLKHAPATLADYLICDEKIGAVIGRYLNRTSMDPLLLYGPPGTGKTQLAQLLPRAVIPSLAETPAGKIELSTGDTLFLRSNTLSGNQLLKQLESFLSMTKLTNDEGASVIIMDEVDTLGVAFLNDLKSTLDHYMRATTPLLVIMTTNYVGKIPLALQSRCNCVEMGCIAPQDLVPLAMKVLIAEGKTYTPGQVHRVLSAGLTTSLDFREMYKRLALLL
ncbi:ATP-binding protein [Agrobacterium rhizogenes]|uniref:ATP-binding protein n=1 Tax=Rhizobium rhizogenes TaxID=359 RepID=UPI001574AA42|nr:ATP-binding protein [Rhizobium rhizogenes]NTI62362.1 ATP-binding protein [Rhizobium rhizogenes]